MVWLPFPFGVTPANRTDRHSGIQTTLTSQVGFQVQARPAAFLLTAILVIGAIPRYALVGYGLPDVYHPDEINLLHETYKFWFSILNLNFSISTNLFSYFLSVAHGIEYVLCIASHACVSSADFQRMVLLDHPALFLSGRLLSATFDVGNIYLTYRLGTLLFGYRAGLVAGLGYAVTAIPVAASVWVKMDSVAAFFILLAQIAIVRAMPDQRPGRWYAAGAITGLALGARINAAPLVLSLVVAFWMQSRETVRQSSSAAPLPWKVLPGVLGVMLATYLLVSFRATEVIAHAVGQSRLFWTHPYLEVMVSKALHDWQGNAWQMVSRNTAYYATVFLGTVGALGVLVMAMGVVVTAKRADQAARLSFIFPGLYLLPLLLYSTYMSHYVLVLLPFLFCYLGFVLQWLAERFRSVAPLAVAPSLVIAVVIVLAYPARVTTTYVGYLADNAHQDTRVRAKDWIEATIVDGATIAIEKHHELPNLLPPITETRDEIHAKLLATRELRLGSGKALEAKLEAAHSPSYVIVNLSLESPFGIRGKPFENAYDPDLLRRQGVQYVILGEHIPESYVSKELSSSFPEKRATFLAWLERNADMVGNFPPQGSVSTMKVVRLLSWFMVDPSITIYRLKSVNEPLT